MKLKIPFIEKIQVSLLVLMGLVFFCLFVILAYFNRFPYEDYTFISHSKDRGPLQAMAYIYKIYSARWSAHSLAFSFSMLYEKKHFLFLFNLTTLLTLLFSIYLLLKRILNEYFYFAIQKITLIVYTILFTVCFFFASYDIGQVWFWYMVSWMYMWSIIAGNFLFWVLLSKKMNWIHSIMILILTAYIAGATESYTLIYIVCLAAILILKKQNIDSIFISKIAIRPLIISLSLLTAFYMITLLAPGTWARKERLIDATFTEHAIRVINAYGNIILFQTPKLIPYLLIFGIPWLLVGQSVSSKEKKASTQLIHPFIKSLFAMAVLIFILIAPASWILYDLPPARALSQASYLMVIYVSFIFFYIGYKIQIPKKISNFICASTLTVGVIIIYVHMNEQYSIVNKYSKEYDGRITRIAEEENSGRKTTFIFEPLPRSGMVYSDELSPDSTLNNYFEKIYSPNFHVAVKKN